MAAVRTPTELSDMSKNDNSNSSSSFSHAFLPGLILGLIVGAVAGAFLPDLLGGSKLSALDRDTGSITEPGAYEGVDPDSLTDEKIQEGIDDAAAAAKEAEDAAEDLPTEMPDIPASDG